MFIRKIFLLFSCMVFTLILPACTMSAIDMDYTPSTNSIYFGDDGIIKSAIFEDVEGAEYSSEELRNFVQAEIDTFNSVHGEGAVNIEEVAYEDEDARLKLVLSYKDAASLLGFAEFSQDDTLKLESVSLENLSNSDIELKDLPSKVARKKDAKLVSIEGEAKVYTQGRILYTSGSGISEQTEHELSISNNGLNYIVFE